MKDLRTYELRDRDGQLVKTFRTTPESVRQLLARFGRDIRGTVAEEGQEGQEPAPPHTEPAAPDSPIGSGA